MVSDGFVSVSAEERQTNRMREIKKPGRIVGGQVLKKKKKSLDKQANGQINRHFGR